MIVSHRFTKNIVVDLNYTEPFCIFNLNFENDHKSVRAKPSGHPVKGKSICLDDQQTVYS